MDDPAGKYQLLDSLPAAPGHCWLTKAIDGPFLDTGVDIKFNERGRFYVAVEAVREMAQAAGLFDGLEPVDPDRDSRLLQQGYEQGVEARGTLDLAAEQLVAAADRLTRPAGLETDEPADEEPAVFVTDGPDRPAPSAGGDGESPAPVEPRGQGNGTRRNRRPAGVSSGAGDGNPFRI